MTAYSPIMSDETRAHFSATKARWTPGGWELTIQLSPEITERVFDTAEDLLSDRLDHVVGSSARAFYESRTQSSLPRLVIVADQVFDADPVELRETIDGVLKVALEEVTAQQEHENTAGREWLRAFGDES